MAAFGSTTKAVSTYDYIDTRIRAAFPENLIIWCYTSHMVRDRLQETNNSRVLNPAEALELLMEQGHQQTVVQSLHLLAGYEFHKLKSETSQDRIRVSLGLPILSTINDFRIITSGLVQLLQSRPDDEALVLIGHGTYHPSWPSFLALEYFLRDHFGGRIFSGCIEHFPTSEETVARIVKSGFKRACLIPFMLIAGRHFQRDIISPAPASWQSCCQAASISASFIDKGIGMEPYTSDILINHINNAMNTLRLENQP